MAASSEVQRICSICEAGCGLTASIEGDRITAVRGNGDDVFSRGHLCPKGIAMGELHNDPRRLRTPMIRDGAAWVETDWRSAFDLIAQRLNTIRSTYGNDAVALYLGNPTVHNVGLATGIGVITRTLKSKQLYSAASVDQMPKQLANELMFGDDMSWPVPDIERCDTLLMLGANPVVSNGSLWMVPKFRDHVRRLKQRGGKLITIDPRYTETGRIADEHLLIRPAGDAWLLIGLINLVRIERGLPTRYRVHGSAELFTCLDRFELDDVAANCGIEAARIRALATTLLEANRPAVYGRIGTTLQANGTVTSFLIEVLNMMLGQLDAPGGAMFPEQPYASFSRDKTVLNYDRYRSPATDRPEIAGQFPLSSMAEEMEAPVEHRVRALLCFAGNPALSATDSPRLKRAIANLDFHVSVDFYRSETNATADVILPGCSPFEECHYDHFFGASTYRNVARYSPPVMDRDRPDEWQTTLAIAFGLKHGHAPSDAQLHEYEDDVVAGTIARYVADSAGPLYGRDIQEIAGSIGPKDGVERLLDLGIRAGRWGDHFGSRDGLTLARLEHAPHGVDLGPLEPRLDAVIQHPDKHIDLAPAPIITALRDLPPNEAAAGFRLIGRRHVKTNNSWLHGLAQLQRGRDVAFAVMQVDDARSLDIDDGDTIELTANDHSLRVAVETTAAIARGVIAFPHGHPAINYNDLVSCDNIDQPTGTGAMNGVAVTVTKAP